MPGSSVNAGAAGGVHVRGLRELNRAFRHAEKDAKRFARETERKIAEPVRLDVQRLAVTKISGLARENQDGMAKWALMRTGITQRLIYVAPVQRGRASRHDRLRRRPNLKVLLLERAMDPAWEAFRPRAELMFEDAMDTLADRFNHY